MGGAVLDEKRGYKAQKPLVSFVPPSAGMFVWLAVHLDSHKDFEKVKARGEDPNRVLLEKLFIELAEHKVRDCSKDIIFHKALTLVDVSRRSSSYPASSLMRSPVSLTRAQKISAFCDWPFHLLLTMR